MSNVVLFTLELTDKQKKLVAEALEGALKRPKGMKKDLPMFQFMTMDELISEIGEAQSEFTLGGDLAEIMSKRT